MPACSSTSLVRLRVRKSASPPCPPADVFRLEEALGHHGRRAKDLIRRADADVMLPSLAAANLGVISPPGPKIFANLLFQLVSFICISSDSFCEASLNIVANHNRIRECTRIRINWRLLRMKRRGRSAPSLTPISEPAPAPRLSYTTGSSPSPCCFTGQRFQAAWPSD